MYGRDDRGAVQEVRDGLHKGISPSQRFVVCMYVCMYVCIY